MVVELFTSTNEKARIIKFVMMTGIDDFLGEVCVQLWQRTVKLTKKRINST